MGTKIYGASDYLIEFDGDLTGEIGVDDADERGTLVICSDGTLLDVSYGKNEESIWEVKLVRRGKLFIRINQCDDPDAPIYSDIATFKSGLKWAYAASEWEPVK